MPAVHVVEGASALTPDEFVAAYEAPSRPCVLRGLTDEWDAARGRWSVGALCARFPGHQWDMGLESGVTTSLPAFVAEARAGAPADGAPRRYIFDDTFGEALPELLRDFAVPRIFPTEAQDPLTYLSTVPALRPRYRWLLVGLPGSGFTIHQDPFATSAWNALLEGGAKRWVLLPPSTPLGLVLPSLAGREGELAGGGGGAQEQEQEQPAPRPAPGYNPNQPQEPPPYWAAPDSEDGASDAGVELPEEEASAAGWFAHVLPGLRRRAAGEYGLASDEDLGLLDFVQRPGDVVFIPAGWWHVALTLPPEEGGAGGGAGGAAGSPPPHTHGGEHRAVTVAVTYNYLPAVRLEEALAKLAARPGGAASAFRWCARAAAAGVPEAARCLALPAIAAGAAGGDGGGEPGGEGGGAGEPPGRR